MKQYFNFKIKMSLVLSILLVISIISGISVIYFKYKDNIKISQAGAGHNILGFAWSENIGWISFNSSNCDADNDGNSDGLLAGCPLIGSPIPDYGVNVDLATGNFSGYAWSSNVGWVSFEEGSAPSYAFNSNCPDTCDSSINCTACYNSGDGNIYGWAKILALGDDGWLKMGEVWSNSILSEEVQSTTFSEPIIISQADWTLLYVNSEELFSADQRGEYAFDGDVNTFWHSEWLINNPAAVLPHEIQIDLGSMYDVSGFKYLPRTDGENGNIKDYEFYVSDNTADWGTAVTGTFPIDTTEQEVLFSNSKAGRYIRFVALSSEPYSEVTAVRELNVFGTATSEAISFSVSGNLRAEVISSSEINLSWSSFGVGEYRIYRNGEWIETTEERIYSDIGLSPNTTYTYSVLSYDISDEGVSINTDNDFAGWAWNDNNDNTGIGWISFNCDNNASCGVSDYKVYLRSNPPIITNGGQSMADVCLLGANPQAQFIWGYFDLDGNPQSAYQVEIYKDAALTLLAVGGDSGKVLSASNVFTVPAGVLEYGKEYWYKVRVWNSNDAESNVLTCNFDDLKSISHQYPTVAFSYDPSVDITQFQEITFDPILSQAYGGFSILSYEWDFDYDETDPMEPSLDDSTIPVDPTTSHSYAEVKTYKVNLKVTDSSIDGYSCMDSKFIDVGNASLPKWDEVNP